MLRSQASIQMAHLPPKVPTLNVSLSPCSWPPTFPRPSSMASFFPCSSFPAVDDEFLDLSSVHRVAHRRAASDSEVAFFQAPNQASPSSSLDFLDRLDEEQLASMLTNDAMRSQPSAAPPPRLMTTATASMPMTDTAPTRRRLPATISRGRVSARLQRLRILANRRSAQRSRVRKLQYIAELERSVSMLQTKVSTLSPTVAFFDHQRSLLNVRNSLLRQRIAALAQDKIFKDAHQEALKKEIERLRQVYHRQKLGEA
ncbi:hypothetical protein HPP92_023985 [Vanilla planifolia]|uniref:BZIP domain-containing protein n=1 Tax=Vanilla planifolia TaxID=51239 RepID=A0A835PRC5_VANPL|nr:hypothetical protein HPP92_023985 [Vanilla planifolia]